MVYVLWGNMQATETPSTTLIDFDGGSLTGTLLRPARAQKGRVLIAGATGVPQRFYRHFAGWLATHHELSVLTFDYRGFGASARGLPRYCPANMIDWGLNDVAAALKTLKAQTETAPTFVIGHSLGGLLLSRVRGVTAVDRIVCVASGPLHLSDHPWPYRALAASFWYGHGPLIVRALGYLPGRLSGFGSDLPAGVYWQWRKWCTERGALAKDLGKTETPDKTFKGEARFVAASDDPITPPNVVWRLMKDYPDAWLSQATLRPSAAGLRKIGHLGLFSPEAKRLWPYIIGRINYTKET